jgi:hypothetical protein
MTREQLIGTWRCRQTGGVKQLNPDGTGISRWVRKDGKIFEGRLEWSYTDPTHWHLGVFIKPVPHIPSLENGTVQGIDYEIVAEDASTMSLMEFDVEFAQVWERVNSLA